MWWGDSPAVTLTRAHSYLFLQILASDAAGADKLFTTLGAGSDVLKKLNRELVKKPRDLLEYVVVHEMLHLREPVHSERFHALLDTHYPSWREARAELNALPLGVSVWTR